MSKLTALILAGSRPGVDPFAASFGVPAKALIPVHGEPMLVRPVRALLDSPEVGEIIVLSQQPELIESVMPAQARLSFRRSQGTIADTLCAVCNDPATPFPVLVTTADHALLTPAMIAEFVTKAQGADIAVAFVESKGLLARFPDAQRTWLAFGGGRYSGANLFLIGTPAAQRAINQWRQVEQDRKKGLRVLARFPDAQRTWLAFGGGRYSGANLFLIGTPAAQRAINQWRQVEQDRKKGLRVLAALGPALFMGAVLRLRTLQQTAVSLGRKLGIVIHAVEMSDPLAAIDVDKASDHVLVEQILSGKA